MESFIVLERNREVMVNRLKATSPEPATTHETLGETGVGSVFVSNYPPYSFWDGETVPKAIEGLSRPSAIGSSLGLYLHIPFCRKRCKFCYFRVYTDKNSSEIQVYTDALAREVEIFSEQPGISDRPLRFVYFGGGTPSYISARHLRDLVGRLKRALPWDKAEEIAFECEPGTLTKTKLEAIKDIGVTRLSLGIENLNDSILKENGRAHLSQEVFEVSPWIRDLEFDQVNVDLIAGMAGEQWSSWRDTVRKTIDLDPDSVTIYQMELPYNTVYSKALFSGEGEVQGFADWDTKREWHAYAFDELSNAGYEISSAYTMVKKGRPGHFVYRDAVWGGNDMIGAGIASFSYIGGLHFQNYSGWDEYLSALGENRLPLDRAFETTEMERLTREMILKLKLGRLESEYFFRKFRSDIFEVFGPAFRKLQAEEMLTFEDGVVSLTRKGLLQVDQLLPEFYDPKYQKARYT